MTPCEAST